jgi:hypothetical protein
MRETLQLEVVLSAFRHLLNRQISIPACSLPVLQLLSRQLQQLAALNEFVDVVIPEKIALKALWLAHSIRSSKLFKISRTLDVTLYSKLSNS